MPKVLSGATVKRFRETGYHFPVRVLTATEADGYRRHLEAYEARTGGPISGPYRHKSHLLFTWLDELVRHPTVLDLAEDVLGPNLFCWSTSFFIKEQQSSAYVSWHQDATYWGLSSPDVMTVWIAFTPANLENGCMKFVPGTHALEVVPHRDTFAKDNLLTRGQEIAVEVDEAKAVDVILEPGEASLHHVRLVHGSAAEPLGRTAASASPSATCRRTSADRRATRDSATLVRGVDEHTQLRARSRGRAATSTRDGRVPPGDHRPAGEDPLSRHRRRRAFGALEADQKARGQRLRRPPPPARGAASKAGHEASFRNVRGGDRRFRARLRRGQRGRPAQVEDAVAVAGRLGQPEDLRGVVQEGAKR